MPHCERCRKQFIDEEFSSHHCDPLTIKLQEIGIHQMYGSTTDKNNDKVYIAKGLNGIMYRLVECSHNPTHTNLAVTLFENEVAKVRFERNLD